MEAWAAARKHAAVAEFIRRRPHPDRPLAAPAEMPEAWDESITAELAGVLAESRWAADAMLGLAYDLEVKLPGTKAAFRDGPGFAFTATAGPGTWRLRVPGTSPDLLVSLDPIDTAECDHRFQARGHDPGVKLRHLTQVRHAACTGPCCRRPAAQCDYDHNTPYEAAGRTCLCNGAPKCRRDHRLKQDPRWTVDQLPDGTFRWTTPTGRTFTTEPTRHPI